MVAATADVEHVTYVTYVTFVYVKCNIFLTLPAMVFVI